MVYSGCGRWVALYLGWFVAIRIAACCVPRLVDDDVIAKNKNGWSSNSWGACRANWKDYFIILGECVDVFRGDFGGETKEISRMWYLSGQLSKKPLGPQLLSHPTLPLGISIILCKQLFELVVIAAASHIHDNYSKGLWSIWAPLLCKYSINRMSSWAQTPGTWILLN